MGLCVLVHKHRVQRAGGQKGGRTSHGHKQNAGLALSQGYTYINLSTIKSILIHDPGSKRTREWWERWRGGVGRLRCLLRREGARCQPRPRDWHFNKRLLQCPVWYNNRVTPLLVSSFLPEPRGPSALSCYLPSSPRQLSPSAVEGRTPGKGPKKAPRGTCWTQGHMSHLTFRCRADGPTEASQP